MSRKSETRLQRKIHAALRKQCGGEWFKVHGGPFQAAGLGDLIGCCAGFYFMFEVKVPLKGKPSVLQLETLHLYRKAGAIACIVETPSQAVSLVKAAQASPRKRRKGRKLYKWICRTLRSTHGEDLGYGRSSRRTRRPRRPARWAVNQFNKYMGKIPKGETWPLHGMP